jgi:hypothetical protein
MQPEENTNNSEGLSQTRFAASNIATGVREHKLQTDLAAAVTPDTIKETIAKAISADKSRLPTAVAGADQTSMVIFSSTKKDLAISSSPIDCSASTALDSKQVELLREAAKIVLETEDINRNIDGCNPILQVHDWVQCNMLGIIASYLPQPTHIDEAGVLKPDLFNTSRWANPADQAKFLEQVQYLQALLVNSVEFIIHYEDAKTLEPSLARMRRDKACLEANLAWEDFKWNECAIEHALESEKLKIENKERSNGLRNSLLKLTRLDVVHFSQLLSLAEYIEHDQNKIMTSLQNTLRRICGIVSYRGPEGNVAYPGGNMMWKPHQIADAQRREK